MKAAKVAEKAKASSVRQLRRQATDLLRQLSPERLKVAVEFLGEGQAWGSLGSSFIAAPPKLSNDCRPISVAA